MINTFVCDSINSLFIIDWMRMKMTYSARCKQVIFLSVDNNSLALPETICNLVNKRIFANHSKFHFNIHISVVRFERSPFSFATIWIWYYIEIINELIWTLTSASWFKPATIWFCWNRMDLICKANNCLLEYNLNANDINMANYCIPK